MTVQNAKGAIAMKGCFGFVFLAIVGVIAYLAFFRKEPAPAPTPPPQVSGPPATATPGLFDASPAAPYVPPAQPAPAAAGGGEAASPDVLKRLIELGAQAGVQVQIVGQQGKNVSVRAEWMGDVAANGGDYMELVFRETTIVRDVQDKGGRRWYDKDNRSRWTQDFVVILR